MNQFPVPVEGPTLPPSLAQISARVSPVGALLLLVGLGSYPSVVWMMTASRVQASLAVLIAGAGIEVER